MGRRSLNGGVRAKGADRIEFTFTYEGVRYRPTVPRIPSEANLRRARKELADIKARIRSGMFVFANEFPDYRHLGSFEKSQPKRTCNQVFDDFMAHCESRMTRNDLAFATVDSYRKILDNVWRPHIGNQMLEEVKYSTLVKIADAGMYTKKTHNNVLGPLRLAFDHGYRDHPEKHNPARRLPADEEGSRQGGSVCNPGSRGTDCSHSH